MSERWPLAPPRQIDWLAVASAAHEDLPQMLDDSREFGSPTHLRTKIVIACEILHVKHRPSMPNVSALS
jgi:hypothetical protein